MLNWKSFVSLSFEFFLKSFACCVAIVWVFFCVLTMVWCGVASLWKFHPSKFLQFQAIYKSLSYKRCIRAATWIVCCYSGIFLYMNNGTHHSHVSRATKEICVYHLFAHLTSPFNLFVKIKIQCKMSGS